MHRFNLIQFLLLATLLSSCRREEPHPELQDPVYKGLLEQTGQLKSQVESDRKKIEELEKALAKTDPMTFERKMTARDLEAARLKQKQNIQTLSYMQIRSERRRVETRRNYKIAFERNLAWPDPKEFEHFETQHRLRTAPRHWDARVPKLAARLPSSKSIASSHKAEKKEKVEEE